MWPSQLMSESDLELCVHKVGLHVRTPLPDHKQDYNLVFSNTQFAARCFCVCHHSLLRDDDLQLVESLPIVEDVLVRSRFLVNLH